MKNVLIILALLIALGAGGFFGTMVIVRGQLNAESAKLDKPKTGDYAKDIAETSKQSNRALENMTKAQNGGMIGGGVGAVAGLLLGLLVTRGSNKGKTAEVAA